MTPMANSLVRGLRLIYGGFLGCISTLWSRASLVFYNKSLQCNNLPSKYMPRFDLSLHVCVRHIFMGY